VEARAVAESVDELLGGAVRLGDHDTAARRSGARFEAVEVDGARCVVKYVHPDLDFTMRVSGDLGCRPRRVYELGLMDAAPELIDHAVLGAARWGRGGFGVALLMRDASADLVPECDDALADEQHAAFLDHAAGLAARLWGWHDDADDPALLPYRLRWSWFAPHLLATEADLGFPEPVPRTALAGWSRFDRRAPADVAGAGAALLRDPAPLVEALLPTPSTLLHGDWKLSNLGTAADGRTVLLDWAYPGEGPVAHELAWYLALNRSRLPLGCTKEATCVAFEAALRAHGVDTAGWWDRQLALCLLGALVQFGWEKALGDDAELGWWCDAAHDGLALL
jgi:hypothetical protein